MDRLTRADFRQSLRDALYHLYDAEHLRRNRLADLLNVANRLESSSLLRNILINAIEALKPKDADLTGEHAWRIYDSLFYCYVQRLSQQAVAHQMGLSTRQLRREQHAALELLADYLYQEFNLEHQVLDESAPTPKASSAYQDLEWLRTAPVEKPVEVSEELRNVLELVQPLAANHSARVEVRLDESLPRLAVHPLAFEQILLDLLSLAIPRAAGRTVLISVSRAGPSVRIETYAQVEAASANMAEEAPPALGAVDYLVELSQGHLALEESEGVFRATLDLPSVNQISVVVIDDNPDILQLLERYAYGTRYHLVGMRDPEKALTLAEELQPEVIVLDVVIPGVDGWKLLGRLRHHPRTGHIPIVICSILPQEKLALALGSSGFLKKPVSRQDFLAVLDQQMALKGSESG